MWLISFSEATRFTPQKYRESVQWCEDNKRPQPQHLLYPRTKGFVATVQHVRHAPHVRAVYDLTIAYQKGQQWQAGPAFWETLSVPGLSNAKRKEGRQGAGRAYKFEVHARRFPMEELPTDDDELVKWIEQRWVEKGEWLERKRAEWAREAEWEEEK